MFEDDISKVAGSSLCKSLSPGHQVDGVPGAISTKAIWAAQGKKWPAPIGDFRSKFD